jgi:hypothetical protein
MSLRAIGVAITLMLAGAIQAMSQEESEREPLNTRLGAFLAARGPLVVKDSYPLGSIRGLSLEALVLLDPGDESEKVKGLRVEITEQGRVSRTRSSYADVDELEGLLRVVDDIDCLVNEWRVRSPESHNAVTFATRGNFRLGCYQKGGDRRIFASTGVIGKADILGDPEELPKLRELLRLASETLKGLWGQPEVRTRAGQVLE